MPIVVDPEPRTPVLAVQHAATTLRAGGVVRVASGNGEVIEAVAAETLDRTDIAMRPAPGARLLLTGERLLSLGTPADAEQVYAVPLAENTDGATIAALIDPATPRNRGAHRLVAAAQTASTHAAAVIELCKLAGLLPAAIVAEAGPPVAEASQVTTVELAAVLNYRRRASGSLRRVSEARVPLFDAEDTRIVAFRPSDGGPEQIAILIGDPENHPAPLARLHSECFTGDFLGSLRCDCGDQLRGAIRRMAQEGAGVLLYLAQEGRGIGLTNKLRAYQLQDAGLDTVEANQHLGFHSDERDYWAAASMLRELGITRVRLLTNNPAKIAQLGKYGIDVVGRVPHIFEANAHNRDYLLTKALKSGHMLSLDELQGNGSVHNARLSVV